MVTTGTLSVTGISTLTGAVTAASTLAVTGLVPWLERWRVPDYYRWWCHFGRRCDRRWWPSGFRWGIDCDDHQSATSTISVGCVQMYQPAQRLHRFSFNTSSATSTIEVRNAGFVTELWYLSVLDLSSNIYYCYTKNAHQGILMIAYVFPFNKTFFNVFLFNMFSLSYN